MTWLRVLLLLLLLGYLSTGVYQIRPDERAVVRRFGSVAARPGPGLWISWPWGIDRLDRMKVRTVRQLNVGYNPEYGDDAGTLIPGQFLTGDQNLVNIKLVVDYAIDDSDGALEDYLVNRPVNDAVLYREVESAVAEWVAGRPVDEVLLTGRAALPLWLSQRLPDRIVPHRLGLIVQRVSVDYLAAPSEVRDAFEAVTQAQTTIRTRQNQAAQQAAEMIREAESDQFRLEREAESYRLEQLALAEADSQAFRQRLGEYLKLRQTNPDILAGMWWDEVGRLLLSMKGRGRIDILDNVIGPDGLDITQIVPPKK